MRFQQRRPGYTGIEHALIIGKKMKKDEVRGTIVLLLAKNEQI
jgi:hypothetical protein